MESLKAQAVLARTLAVKGGDHPDGSLCDLTHCQVFSGDRSAQGRQVALATRGLILTYGGLPVTGLYHSTCAGARASNQAIFGGRAVSYLQGGPDPFCQASPHARPWRAIVSRAELAAALGVPSVEAIVLLDRTPGGWVTRLSVDGQRMTGYRFWQAIGRHLGWGELKSLRFMVRREGDRFVFTGIGLGHGVGLCQWGARGRAIAGRDYRRVLAAYFPGTQLKAI